MHYKKTAYTLAGLAVALGFVNYGLGLVFAVAALVAYLLPRGN